MNRVVHQEKKRLMGGVIVSLLSAIYLFESGPSLDLNSSIRSTRCSHDDRSMADAALELKMALQRAQAARSQDDRPRVFAQSTLHQLKGARKRSIAKRRCLKKAHASCKEGPKGVNRKKRNNQSAARHHSQWETA